MDAIFISHYISYYKYLKVLNKIQYCSFYTFDEKIEAVRVSTEYLNGLFRHLG